ncbi:MAG: penicillin-binding protein 2, partial [Tidjanibacter sp.]|nr:penicillin-binding protein 2 [Tidjanibacter sp.]
MKNRFDILRLFVVVLFVVVGVRLFHIQIVDRSYRRAAENNVLRYEVLNPPRGEIYDRNGEFLAQSVASYDLMLVPRNLPKEGFDTVALARIAGVSVDQLKKSIQQAKNYSNSRASVVVKQMTTEAKLLFDEA